MGIPQKNSELFFISTLCYKGGPKDIYFLGGLKSLSILMVIWILLLKYPPLTHPIHIGSHTRAGLVIIIQVNLVINDVTTKILFLRPMKAYGDTKDFVLLRAHNPHPAPPTLTGVYIIQFGVGRVQKLVGYNRIATKFLHPRSFYFAGSPGLFTFIFF